MAWKVKDQILDKCTRCEKIFIVRDDRKEEWNPNWQLPVSFCGYEEKPYCKRCKRRLLKLVEDFNAT